MKTIPARPLALMLLAPVMLLLAEPAAAFRCGNKLVKDGMHEQQVVAICGEPASIRHLGYALRSYAPPLRRRPGTGFTEYYYPGYGVYAQEVLLTEYIYNFGPRRKMQRLIFEGGILATIEDIGYGYRKKR